MIKLQDLYNVLTAVVPLYVALVLAYGSVRWWDIFTPVQCAGINRFVALFAVPLLSFHFIALNNPYTMNFRFIAADTLQKLIILSALFVWSRFCNKGSLEWSIILFSLSTLPNTLVMGIPLLKGMYGESSGSLMVQIVVLQCIIWYTLMLFLFEYRGARTLISEQFPETANTIASFRVDSDVISLNGEEPLQTEAEVGEDGKLHVTVRKSTSSRSEIFSRRSQGHSCLSLTPRPSNMTNAEIYSLQTSRNPTPRQSNFGVDEERSTGIYPAPSSAGIFSPASCLDEKKKDLHMFVWSSSASPVSEGGISVFGGAEYGSDINLGAPPKDYDDFGRDAERGGPVLSKVGSTTELRFKTAVDAKPTAMPPASVITRLILIMVWRKLIRNPNTYSSLIGLIWSLVAFKWQVEMPAIIAKSISILSDAGLGMAMVSLGLFMALQQRIIACGKSVAATSMAVRFIAGPAVMAAASAEVLHIGLFSEW